MATPNRRYTEIPGPVTPDVPYWVNQALRDVDADMQGVEVRHSAATAEVKRTLTADLVNTGQRLQSLETLGGLAPGDVTDATAADLVNNPATATARAIDARTAHYGDSLRALQAWLPRAAPAPLGKLTDWRTALASGKATVVAVGDSITEGSGTTNIRNRWQTLLQTALRAQQSSIVGAVFPFIPGYPVTGAAGKPVTHAAPVTRQNSVGITGRTVQLSTAESLVEFEFYGTSCQVMFFAASATALATISIDGGIPVEYETNTLRRGGGSSVADLWTSPALARGTHKVQVRRAATNPNTTDTLWVEGLITYDRDESTGIRVLDGGYHGARSGTFETAWIPNHARAVKAAGGADLVILGFGVNDTQINGKAAFKANIENYIAQYRAAGINSSFLLVGMFKINSLAPSQWKPYLEALAEIAYASPKTAFLDLGNHMPAAPTPHTAPEGLGLFNDGIHPNDAGNAWIAQVLSNALSA